MRHKTPLKWIVEHARSNQFEEEFTVFGVMGGTGALIGKVEVRRDDITTRAITPTVVKALVDSGLLLQRNKANFSLKGQAYFAVDSILNSGFI